MIVYKNGRALVGDRLIKTDIAANHGRIIEIAPDIVPDEQTETVDCANRYLLPALVDLCSYGANGQDFNTANEAEMKSIVEFYIAHGVGTVFATLKADTDANLLRQLQLIVKLSKDYPEIKGIHLDGPFVAPQCTDRPSELLQKPSMDKFMQYQRAAEGKIRLVTVAPELPDALPFISELTDSRVTVSLGHSMADEATLQKALDVGAKCVTDWGNNMSPFTARDAGLCGGALLHDCFCMAVFDPSHLSPSAMKLLCKTKPSDKLVGITADTADAYQGLANVVTHCDKGLTDAIKLWTVNPARLVNMSSLIGTIEVGKHADFIIFG